MHGIILRLPKGYDTPIGTGGSGSRADNASVWASRARCTATRPWSCSMTKLQPRRRGRGCLVNAISRLKTDGKTVVLITHRPSVLSVVDFLLVLRDGAVQGYGPRNEVLAALNQAARQQAQPNARPVTPVAPRPPGSALAV